MRTHDQLREIPSLACEVLMTRGAPNPNGPRSEIRGGSFDPQVPLDLGAWDMLRLDEHGQLAQLSMCVRLVAEEKRDAGLTWPDLQNPATWVGECDWLLATEAWWQMQPWRDDVEHAVGKVWAALCRAARVTPPLRLTCPRCQFPVHGITGWEGGSVSFYQCEAGHILDHAAELRRLGEIQEFTTAEVVEVYGITDRTLRNWKAGGWVKPCGTRGKQMLWAAKDIVAAKSRLSRTG